MLTNPFRASGLLSQREGGGGGLGGGRFKLTCKANPGPVDQWSKIKHSFFADSEFWGFHGGLNCIVANASNNGHGTFGFLSLGRPRLCVKPAEGNPQERDAQRRSLN